VKIRALLFAIALLFGAVLAGAADPRGELRVAIPWTPENLDPTMNLASIRATVGASLFDSLVGRDRDNRIVPELAESWRLLNDTTWQLKLRRGVVFHNGEPFNAEAVRATVERVLDPNQKSPNRANIAEIVRVDLLDQRTEFLHFALVTIADDRAHQASGDGPGHDRLADPLAIADRAVSGRQP
jgi:peptide/nickel transport system substrate-binding protein